MKNGERNNFIVEYNKTSKWWWCRQSEPSTKLFYT